MEYGAATFSSALVCYVLAEPVYAGVVRVMEAFSAEATSFFGITYPL